MEKQIEEMARDLQDTHNYEGCEAWHCRGCSYEQYGKEYFCQDVQQAEKLIAKGYRKVEQGEWIETKTGFICTVCNTHEAKKTNYCPNCGACMKGAE